MRFGDIAERLGFKGGRVLEASAGIGNIIGQMPVSMSENSDIHAIEIDDTQVEYYHYFTLTQK